MTRNWYHYSFAKRAIELANLLNQRRTPHNIIMAYSIDIDLPISSRAPAASGPQAAGRRHGMVVVVVADTASGAKRERRPVRSLRLLLTSGLPF